MESSVRQILVATVAVVYLLTSCTEDKAREAAVEQAQQAANAQQNAPATQKTLPETTTVGTLHLAVSSKSASRNSETCVVITARDFDQIVSMQYSVKWDKEVLRFKRVQAFNLPGLGEQNFGAHLAEKEGILTHSWFDANVRGITRPDGANLYEICFDVVGEPGGKSSIQFTDMPTIREISNSASQLLALDGAAGVVEVR